MTSPICQTYVTNLKNMLHPGPASRKASKLTFNKSKNIFKAKMTTFKKSAMKNSRLPMIKRNHLNCSIFSPGKESLEQMGKIKRKGWRIDKEDKQ